MAASNVWIARHLNRGAPQSVSLHTSKFRARVENGTEYQEFIQRFTEWLF